MKIWTSKKICVDLHYIITSVENACFTEPWSPPLRHVGHGAIEAPQALVPGFHFTCSKSRTSGGCARASSVIRELSIESSMVSSSSMICWAWTLEVAGPKDICEMDLGIWSLEGPRLPSSLEGDHSSAPRPPQQPVRFRKDRLRGRHTMAKPHKAGITTTITTVRPNHAFFSLKKGSSLALSCLLKHVMAWVISGCPAGSSRSHVCPQ